MEAGKFSATLKGVGLALGLMSLAAWAADGDLDPAFSTDGKVQVNYADTVGDNLSAAAIQDDGSILAAGALEVTGEKKLFIATFSAAGALLSQPQVVNPLISNISGITVTQDGEIVVVGTQITSDAPRAASGRIVKFNASGASTDTVTFPQTPGATNSAYCGGRALAEAGGKVVVPCSILGADGIIKPALYRFNGDLTADTTFDGDGRAIGTSLNNTSTTGNAGAGDAIGQVVTGDGAGGYYLLARDQSVADTDDATERLYVQHFNAAGALDTVFGSTGVALVYTLAPPASGDSSGVEGRSIYRHPVSGKILIGAARFTFPGTFNAVVARLTTAGALDTSFGGDGSPDGIRETSSDLGSAAVSVFSDARGRVYVLGTNFLIRLQDNGLEDAAYNDAASDVNVLNRPATACGDNCFSSQWMGATLLADARRVLLLGGTPAFIVSGGSPSHNNAIVARVKLDDTPADTTPDAFTFSAQTGRPTGTVVVSNTVTISGVNAAAPISISGGSSPGYSIGCNGVFTATAGTITNGEQVCVRQTSSGSANATTTTTLTVGGGSAPFSVTTAANDTTPNAFSFTAVSDAVAGSTVTSNAVTISGIDAPAPISVSGGQYSINNGAFTATAGTISSGQSVRVQLTASSTAGTQVTATLNVGGTTAPFRVTTAGAADDGGGGGGGGALGGSILALALLAAMRRRILRVC